MDRMEGRQLEPTLDEASSASEGRDIQAHLDSPALLRLIAEVRDGVVPGIGAYNRTYHRHNR